MREVDLTVSGATVVSPSGTRRVGVSVDAGRIVAIAEEELLPPSASSFDASGKLLIPGIIDPEGHPGVYRPLLEDLASESRAAIAAGVTTWGIQAASPRMGHPDFVEFVQPGDVTSFHDVFDHFLSAVPADAATDVFVTYMLETEQQVREIPEYARKHGVTSYKLHLASMIPAADPHAVGRRTGFGNGFDDGMIYGAMRAVAGLGRPGVVAMHCENEAIARVFEAELKAAGRTDWATWSARSPHFAEAHHVRSYGYLAEVTGASIYIQHATTPETYGAIRELRARGVTCYAQTGPHWLHFAAGERNAWRINVPLRSRENNPKIWEALRDDVINTVGSDHAVAWPPTDYDTSYDENVWKLKTGFTSRVEMLLPVLLQGVSEGKLTLERLVEVTSANPARIFGVYPRKGTIEVGSDADFVIVDPERRATVTNDQVLSRSGWTVLEGHTIQGWPVATFLRGTQVARWEDGAPKPEYIGGTGGEYLRRTPASISNST
jgi:dihydroorotase-like cyclic amidohydrolase